MADYSEPDFVSKSRAISRSSIELVDTLQGSIQAAHHRLDEALRALDESRRALARVNALLRGVSTGNTDGAAVHAPKEPPSA